VKPDAAAAERAGLIEANPTGKEAVFNAKNAPQKKPFCKSSADGFFNE